MVQNSVVIRRAVAVTVMVDGDEEESCVFRSLRKKRHATYIHIANIRLLSSNPLKQNEDVK